jgi:hypothetical protein
VFPRWIKKALLLALAAAALGGYLYHDPSLIAPYLRGTALELPERTTLIYRWRDADGTLHHSNSPPPPGVSYETVEVSSQTNIIKLTPAKK